MEFATTKHKFTDRISILTSKLKRHREKKGLYMITINCSKYIKQEDFNNSKSAALSLAGYLLNDPASWVGIFALNESFKTFEKAKFTQKINLLEKEVAEMNQVYMSKPVTTLNRFISGWNKEDKINKNFDIFLIVVAPTTFNPDHKFYKTFEQKKINLVPLLYGNQAILVKDQTVVFKSASEVFTKIKSLITRTDSLESKVEFFPENDAVVIKFITSHEQPEFELHIFKKVGSDLQIAVDPIFLNKKQVRVSGLEPDTKYILKYRFNFSDGLSSMYLEEVTFQTLSQSPKDISLIGLDQAKNEFSNLKENILSYSVSTIEKLMGVFTYNILLFGKIGSGKSSFASTINRAGTGFFDPNFAYVDFSHKSCTKELNKLELFGCSCIKIWDTFGLDDKNYDAGLLENILDGKVKDQYKPDTSPSPIKEPRIGDFVHSVIIVIDVQIFADQEEIEKIKQKVDIIKERRYYPVLVITKLDTLPGKAKQTNCQNMYSHKSSQDILTRANQTFRIDPNNIFFMINYRGEEPQDFYKELLALRILKRSIERARQFINKRKKILVRELNGDNKRVIPLNQEDMSLAEFRQVNANVLSKLVKNENFYFVEYPDWEEDTNLNEIDQIEEELGERIKYITIAPCIANRNKRDHSDADSFNDRDSSNKMREIPTTMSEGPDEDEEKALYEAELNEEAEEQYQFDFEDGEEFKDEKPFDLALSNVLKKSDDEGLSKVFVYLVIDNKKLQEWFSIDPAVSLYTLRQKIEGEIGSLQGKKFSFAFKPDEDNLVTIPDNYETESATKLKKIMISSGETLDCYIKITKS